MSDHDLPTILSRGFSAGNYACAYVSEDFDTAWEAELDDDEDYAENP